MSTTPDPTPLTRKYHDKEEFVTGHSGSSAHEIFLLCLVIPIGLHLYYKIHSWYGYGRRRRDDAKNEIFLGGIVVEFITLMLPMLIVQTSLLSYTSGPFWLLLGMFVLALLIPSSQSRDKNITTGTSQQSPKATQNDDHNNRRPSYLSIHRSCVYILTTIAILAVDFPIFPRRFCKTEISGYGWMDLGAASFIIIAGWSSALSSSASSASTPASALQSSNLPKAATTTNNYGLGILKAIKKCTPLLLIGIVRLATNKGLEYQEHVSEYGVHWNFFFTLCFVEGLMVMWKGLKRQLLSGGQSLATSTRLLYLDGILGLVFLIPYQVFLSRGGGQDFIENGDRRCSESYGTLVPASLAFVTDYPSLCNIFVANREGILGVVGYLSLRLLSEGVARICLLPPRKPLGQAKCNSQRQQHLLIMSAVSWMAHICLTVAFQIPNSRRSTNASFVLWSLAHNASLLCLIHYVTMKVPISDKGSLHVPQILEAVNRFGLAVFLSSNILTGLVNLTVDTLHSSNGKAMLILSIYLALVCGIALLLDIFFKKKKVA